ncbi:hypothetical protein [Hymenobacter weizhouensis]|uniref:hypothetical protein n=1 Tax=Hymenobacter sp. YIM 151500-1 TaxID=2987689 RepID=UPI002227BF3D|nr:hypothetical protein [Hymenobacter sp. YIM 151500-1]UYZ65072.1 hypothetical protein OIS53_09510 [Hymenobacter sp. YIM 151500-1]
MLPLTMHRLGTITDAHGHPVVDAHYSPDHHVLYVQWFGNLTGHEVVSATQELLKFRSQYRLPLLLNDKSQATGDWSDAIDWLEYEWLPQAVQEGLRAIAYVFSPDVHNQLVSLSFLERMRQYVPIRAFGTVPDAWLWLRTQPRTHRGATSLGKPSA